MDLWLLDLENNEPQPLLTDPSFGELSADVSPDGQRIAYHANQNGYRVYVRPFPGGGATTLVSGVGAREPRWSPTGNRLYYRLNGSAAMMAVDFDDAGNPDPPRVLIENAAVAENQLAGSYDIAPGGERFLFREVEVRRASAEASRINVVLNWLEALEQLMATGR